MLSLLVRCGAHSNSLEDIQYKLIKQVWRLTLEPALHEMKCLFHKLKEFFCEADRSLCFTEYKSNIIFLLESIFVRRFEMQMVPLCCLVVVLWFYKTWKCVLIFNRFWHWQVMSVYLLPHQCVYCLRSVIWGQLLLLLCRELGSSTSIQQILGGIRK